MKKLFIILLAILMLVGCSNKADTPIDDTGEETNDVQSDSSEEEPKYNTIFDLDFESGMVVVYVKYLSSGEFLGSACLTKKTDNEITDDYSYLRVLRTNEDGSMDVAFELSGAQCKIADATITIDDPTCFKYESVKLTYEAGYESGYIEGNSNSPVEISFFYVPNTLSFLEIDGYVFETYGVQF